MMAVREYCWESVIYKTICTLEICEFIHCEQKRSNHVDSYAVSMQSHVATPSSY